MKERDSSAIILGITLFGRVGVGSQAPPASVYTRRWTVEPRASGPGGLVLARVLVTPHRDRGRADAIPGARLPGEATLVTIITRRAAP
jgi:hypothetical protein